MPLKRCREEEDTTVTGKMTFKRFRGDGDAAARYVKQWREEKEKEKVSTLNKTDAVTRPMTFLGEEIELLTRAPVAQIASAAPVRPITQTAPVAPVRPIAQTAPVEPVRPIAQIAPVEPVRPIEEIAPVESVRPIEEIVPIAAVGQITSSKQMFECKTCGREFPKFQALGGHCASHTKSELMNSDNNGRYREHECSICGEKFSIGQALGGHMRRHRKITVGTATLQPGFLGIRESVALPMSGGQGEITALSDTSYESFAFDSNRPIDNVVAERQELQDDRPFYKFL